MDKRSNFLQQAVIYAIITVFVLFGTYRAMFSYIAFVLCVMFVVFRQEQYGVSLLLYLVSLANIFKPAAGGQSFYTYILLLFVFIHFIRHRKISVVAFSAIFFIVYLLINQIIHVGFDVNSAIKLGCNILLIIICAQDIDLDGDYSEHSYSYISGVLVGSAIACMNSSIFRISDYIKEKVQRYIGGGYSFRFSGLYNDPNYYAINLIIVLCLVVILNHRGKIKPIIAGGICAACVVFGLMTQSKSALLMFAFPALLFLYSCIVRKRYIVGIGMLTAFIVLIGLSFSGRFALVNTVLYRFTMQGTDISTGRFGHWNDYMTYFWDNPSKLIFGNSTGIYLLAGSAAHNTYIDFLYQLGIFGSIWLLYILFALARKKKRHFEHRRSLMNHSIFLCVIIMYFTLSELQYFDAPIHLVVAYMILGADLADGKEVLEDEFQISY